MVVMALSDGSIHKIAVSVMDMCVIYKDVVGFVLEPEVRIKM